MILSKNDSVINERRNASADANAQPLNRAQLYSILFSSTIGNRQSSIVNPSL